MKLGSWLGVCASMLCAAIACSDETEPSEQHDVPDGSLDSAGATSSGGSASGVGGTGGLNAGTGGADGGGSGGQPDSGAGGVTGGQAGGGAMGGAAGAGGLTGRCSTTGDPCAANNDCSDVPIVGHCLRRKDAEGSVCVYDTRFQTQQTVTCEGQTYGKCFSAFECPTSMYCDSFGTNWCGTYAEGLCSYGVTGLLGDPAANCTSDEDCTVARDNSCVICGNGAYDSPTGLCGSRCRQEYCDDGNTDDGDFCSSTCQASGVCFSATGNELAFACYNDADCGYAAGCSFDAPCTCRARGTGAGGTGGSGAGGAAGAPNTVLNGQCSSTGATCTADADCPDVALAGKCIQRQDSTGSACLYDTRFATGATVTCADQQYGKCFSAFDCPTGMLCGAYGSNWCGTDAEGICTFGVSGLPGISASNCATDQDCTIMRDNACVICGNGVFDSAAGECGRRCRQEYCDDGNASDGDLCSSKCQASGVCVTATGTRLNQLCATLADCAQAADCSAFGPCSCVPP